MKRDHDQDPDAPRKALRVGMLVGSTAVAAGGVSEAVRSLATAMSGLPGLSLEIFAPDDGGERHSFGDIPVRLVKVRGPASFAYAPSLVDRLLEARLDVLHVHGLWMYLSVAALGWARRSGKPYVVSPHGMLDPWALANGRLKKQLARLAYENAHLANASCLHALCRAEADAFRLAGATAPIAILPNGVAIPSGDRRVAAWRRDIPPEARVALFLGRVTPKKQITTLMRAFDRIAGRTAWHLAIVGPVDEAYRSEVDATADRAVNRDRIHLVGPAYGDDRAAAYDSADLFVLPSLSEGLPMAALEAFAHGVPGLLTTRCNLPEAAACGAAIEVGPGEAEIEEGLQRFFDMPSGRAAVMGTNARNLVRQSFDWEVVSVRMAGLYRQICRDQASLSGLARPLIGRAGLPA